MQRAFDGAAKIELSTLRSAGNGSDAPRQPLLALPQPRVGLKAVTPRADDAPHATKEGRMTSLPVQARPSARSIFRNRSFRLLWTAELISSIGTALTSLAASILVYRVTGSALSVGLMLMATQA